MLTYPYGKAKLHGEFGVIPWQKIDNKLFSYFKVILPAYYMYSPREILSSVYTGFSLKSY